MESWYVLCPPSGGYVTVNGEVKRVSAASGATINSTSGSNNVRSSAGTGTLVVGPVTAPPQTTEYVEEVVEAEGVVMAAPHQEPLTKRPRMEGDGPPYEDE